MCITMNHVPAEIQGNMSVHRQMSAISQEPAEDTTMFVSHIRPAQEEKNAGQ